LKQLAHKSLTNLTEGCIYFLPGPQLHLQCNVSPACG